MKQPVDVKLGVGDWAHPVEGLGPGKRLILWVRGCTLGCPGCMTPEFWDRAADSTLRSVPELAAQLAPFLLELDGLTLSGGEPTEQAAACTALVRALRSIPGLADLEVMSYSGYTIEELATRGPEVAAYLAELDILVDGRFEQSSANDRRWRGSDNQRVHLLSPRAARYAGQEDAPMEEPRPLQVQVLDQDHYRVIGIPRRGDLAGYRAGLAARGLKVRPDVARHPLEESPA